MVCPTASVGQALPNTDPAVGPAIARGLHNVDAEHPTARLSFSGCGRMRPRFALNGLNFFIAAVQAGVGPFIAVWLTEQGWSETALGLTLSIATSAALLGQLPGGVLVDALHTKRFVASGAMVVT